MKVQKVIVIDQDLREKLTTHNASRLINGLLRDYFDKQDGLGKLKEKAIMMKAEKEILDKDIKFLESKKAEREAKDKDDKKRGVENEKRVRRIKARVELIKKKFKAKEIDFDEFMRLSDLARKA